MLLLVLRSSLLEQYLVLSVLLKQTTILVKIFA